MSMPMPIVSSLRLVLLVLLAALPSALAAQTESSEAAKPLPCGEDAYTQARFRADAAAFWREALAAECGRAAPIPDGYKADVEHLLTAVAAAGAAPMPAPFLPRAMMATMPPTIATRASVRTKRRTLKAGFFGEAGDVLFMVFGCVARAPRRAD
jgi:hypothetical protein